jgi:hypothetical protein
VIIKKQKIYKKQLKCVFFLLSTYKIWESIGFTSENSKKKLQILTFLAILFLKNMFRARKKIPSVTSRRRRRRWQKFVPHL